MVRLRHANSTVISELTPAGLAHVLLFGPKLNFYTMYGQETTEYDTEYIRKHNEDLNTTLIFVRFCVPVIAARSQTGLLSAVSSAFVVDVQSNLQPYSGQWSEVYLRALPERCGTASAKLMAWRNGRSSRSSRASPSCYRSRSFSSPVACRSTCSRSTHPSHASSSLSPFWAFSSASES